MNKNREKSRDPEQSNAHSSVGKSDQKKDHNSLRLRDFLPLILAIPSALLVKVMIFNTFHVPTSSMEGTITPGDRIIVEKWIFGPRFFFENSVWRFPGWRSVQRGDILVFNVPREDSIFSDDPTISFYDQKLLGKEKEKSKSKTANYMPIPGRTPFVKRVVGVPGDSISVGRTGLLVNEELPYSDSNTMVRCIISFSDTNTFDLQKRPLYKAGTQVNMNRSAREMRGIWKKGYLEGSRINANGISEIRFAMNIPEIEKIPDAFGELKSLYNGQTITLPYRGWEQKVDSKFVDAYGSLVVRFDNPHAQIIEGKLFVKGAIVDRYTFRRDYYWVLGDNRPFSIDSRFWGMVPDDHIIGITRRVLWSKEPYLDFRNGFRWKRMWLGIL